MQRTAAILFFVFLAPPWLAGARASELTERVLKVPVKLEDMYRKVIEREITVTVFEESGRAPYPLLVLSHGRAPDSAGRKNLGRARYSEDIEALRIARLFRVDSDSHRLRRERNGCGSGR